jgi:hypothetical protein
MEKMVSIKSSGTPFEVELEWPSIEGRKKHGALSLCFKNMEGIRNGMYIIIPERFLCKGNSPVEIWQIVGVDELLCICAPVKDRWLKKTIPAGTKLMVWDGLEVRLY